MDYRQTIDYLFTRLPMFSRQGAAAFKKDLTNTIRLCEALDNPHNRFKAVHIAGTNGKGSVSHMLASVLQAAGYKTGLYTSPHLKDFRERIKINGEWVTEAFVIDFVKRIQPIIEALEPSFFEITVAMAFDYFAQQQVDIAIIETGMGGRFDSTNIIQPLLSVITNIGLDHTNMLGTTLPAIAFEKAGIIKPNTPAIIGETQADTKPVFEEKARQQNAPLVFADRERLVTNFSQDHTYLKVEIGQPHHDNRRQYELDLTGYYQTRNILPVLEAVHQLQQLDWAISTTHLHQGLQQVKRTTGLHGRWEIIRHQPQVVLEVAHNEDGIRQMLAQLELSTYHQLHIVIGMVNDKDITTVLSLLPKEATYYFTRAQIPRALPETELAQKAAPHGLEGHSYPTVAAAVDAALAKARPEDMVLVCGSIFVVGEVEL